MNSHQRRKLHRINTILKAANHYPVVTFTGDRITVTPKQFLQEEETKKHTSNKERRKRRRRWMQRPIHTQSFQLINVPGADSMTLWLPMGQKRVSDSIPTCDIPEDGKWHHSEQVIGNQIYITDIRKGTSEMLDGPTDITWTFIEDKRI